VAASTHEPKFGALLWSLVAILLVQPFAVGHGVASSIALNIALLGVLIGGVAACAGRRIWLWGAVVNAVAAVIASWGALAYRSPPLVMASEVLHLTFTAGVAVRLLGDVLGPGPVGRNRIYGVVSVYLLLGVAWAFAYSLIDSLAPGSFVLAEADGQDGPTMGHLLYYSFVTLTTLGFGDIQPVSSVARTYSALEAIVGQLYLAILVARLVGLHITGNALDDDQSD